MGIITPTVKKKYTQLQVGYYQDILRAIRPEWLEVIKRGPCQRNHRAGQEIEEWYKTEREGIYEQRIMVG